MQKARESLAEARRAISNLRENNLRELMQALRSEVAQFETASGIPCALHAHPIPALPEAFQETILRTVSEALTNVARHAQASEASVAIVLSSRQRENQPEAGEGQNLQVTIRDNGRGFDPDQNPASHYGLLGIRERLRQHTGQLVIKSAPQQGTILTIKLPLPDAALERPARS